MRVIPHNFHFVFGLRPQVEAFHIAHYLCLKSCMAINLPDEVHFHFHHEPHGKWWDRIKDQLVLHAVEPEEFVAAHPGYGEHWEGRFIRTHGIDYAHHSDFIRLKLLSRQGGVYADMDTLFVNPLPPRLFEESFVIGEELLKASDGSEELSLCNAFLMSEAAASFGERWLREMYRVFDGTWSRHSCQAATELAAQFPSEVCIVPQHAFYKHACTPAGIHTLFHGLDPDFNGVYSMHLWAHVWWDPRRTDFSRFHAGMLTEDYIRSVDTTYNVVAREFLP